MWRQRTCRCVYTGGMQTYLVGGAVRDALLTRLSTAPAHPSHVDRDWVVVGATPEDMAAQGYLPVGKDFPVFLHPETKDEYALARTERKTAPGYHGFAFHADPSVTLEDDLARRDLTINAMAVPADRAEDFLPEHIVDPYGGLQDLANRQLRHVTSAFAEDPVRILRLARFAARFANFDVAPETMTLMRQMVSGGEVDHLVAERVWQELSRGLMEQKPSRMFEVLRACGALERLLPEVDRLWGVPQRPEYHPEVDTGVHVMMVLDMAAGLGAPLPVRFACLCHDLGKGTTPAEILPKHVGHEMRSVDLLHAVCDRWRVPRESRELAEVVAREHGNVHRSADMDTTALLRLLERCDAIRRPQRFDGVLLACECDARGRLGHEDRPYPQTARLLAVLQAATSVDTAAVAAQAARKGLAGPQIANLIHEARSKAVRDAL